MVNLLIAVIVSYIIGAIPFSYILGRLLKGVDIREYGSGNVGATNLIRSVGKLPGLIALFLDISKGIIAVVFVARIFYSTETAFSLPTFKIILGVTVVCGHIWTAFLRFKGGKGVATAIGVFIGLAPLAMMFGLCIWGLAALCFRYVSLSSIIMVICLPFVMLFLREPSEYIYLSVILAVFIIYRHRANIIRLIKGTEYKIGQKV